MKVIVNQIKHKNAIKKLQKQKANEQIKRRSAN